MSKLSEDAKKARASGLSYGLWRASETTKRETQACDDKTLDRPRQRPSKRTWTDEQAFAMWQQHMTDGEIGAALGVSKTAIQRWRSNMEIPSLWHGGLNTKKYRLVHTESGVYAVNVDNV